MSSTETANMRRLETVVAELPEAERVVHGGHRCRRERWEIIREWVRTSCTLVATKSLARIVVEQDADSSSSLPGLGSASRRRSADHPGGNQCRD